MLKGNNSAKPLKGITVIDLTMYISGPFATQILGDLGAEIIKVEPPGGDPTRQFAPYFHNNDSMYFMGVNRSKKSVVINLKSEAGLKLLYTMVQKADVVMDNFRPGVTRRLKVDYQRLKEINPAVICCSITGFGLEGTGVDRPAFDMIVQALSGLMSLTGEQGGRPVRAGVPIADLGAGLYAAIAVSAALAERLSKGTGQQIDISMFDCMLTLLNYLGNYYLFSGEVPGLQGRGHVANPTYNTFRTKDGSDLVVTALTEEMWRNLAQTLGLGELADDPRFATNKERLKNSAILVPLLEESFLRRTSGEWLQKLQAAGVPCAPVNSVDKAFDEALVGERDMVIELEHGGGGIVKLLGNPIKMPNSGADYLPPPMLGQGTCSILRQYCGLSDSEINLLVSKGVVQLLDHGRGGKKK
jgi:crotonobetainyl-CoA:carnitine CoA-transferase CaiB-like acyl-CoA transferase